MSSDQDEPCSHGALPSVEDLEVFRLAYALSLELHRASQQWPKSEQYGGVADQIRRASQSVCALMVEGAGRLPGSRAEFKRYLLMALASADEATLWCRYAHDLGYADAETVAGWRNGFGRIARMLHALRNRDGNHS